jgi:cation:H+ antiporter
MTGLVILFCGAAVVIGVIGSRLSYTADVLADRTGLGEAIAGALFLGASTSLPGIITSVTAAAENHPELAISNAIGGIAAQTVFLGIADIFYRRANLEHAAASVPNMLQGTLLIVLLTIPLLAMTTPPLAWFGVHPASVIMLVVYVYGMRMASQAHLHEMWHPHQTSETRRDIPNHHQSNTSLLSLWLRFAVFALVLAGAGWVVAITGIRIADQTGLSETAVGSLLTAIATSLPELVTSVAAVRQGSLTLAVGGIIGGNAFDTLFAAVADIAYRPGSIYHAITERQVFLIVLTILLISILLMGLIRREKRGIAGIGFESFFILLIYAGAVVFLVGG